jgi:hypothetical protein
MGRAELEQSALFPAPTAKPAPPLEVGEYDQIVFSIEPEKPREITIENCVVQTVPTVEQVKKAKKGVREWRCGFSVPSDLWHQDRDELIDARASAPESVALAVSKRLKPGDMVTITGLVTQQRLLVTGVRATQLTHLNVTDIRVDLRAAKNPLFVKGK